MPSKSALLSSAQAVVTANETAAANSAAKPVAKSRSRPPTPAAPSSNPAAQSSKPAAQASSPAAQPSAPAASTAATSTPKSATPRRTSKPAGPASTIAKIATQVIAQAQPASSEMDQVIDKAAQNPKLREKAPAKTVTKTATKAAEKPVKAAQKAEKPAKKSAKKAKLIRDSFTFPADDYALIATTKQRILSAGVEVKKSELIRAGLKALAAMDNAQLLALVQGLEKIKTGRPSK